MKKPPERASRVEFVPKGSKDLTESEIMRAGKDAGLVDVKVVSFSATLTAEKFVVPLARRSQHPHS